MKTKKTKKFLLCIITISMLMSLMVMFVFSVQAEDTETDAGNAEAAEVSDIAEDDDVIDSDLDEAEPMPIQTKPVIPFAQQEPEYAFIDGKIDEVNDYRIPIGDNLIKSRRVITVVSGEGKDESKWIFTVETSTYFITGNRNALKTGANVRVFYNIKAPATLIYPPQLNADFIAVDLAEDKFVAIDRFDDKFTDSKNMLKLNIPEDFNEKGSTVIIYENGDKFEGEPEELINRKLVAVYSVSTRSIPAQTTPEKIIVMYEKAVAPIYYFTDEEKELINKSLENAAITVNGKTIEAPGVFMTVDGIVMVPVRALADALELTVEWFDDTKTVQVGKSLSFSIGEDCYSYNRMAPVKLGAAPVIKDGKTFVPIDFFTVNAIDEIKISREFGYDADAEGTVINIKSEPVK